MDLHIIAVAQLILIVCIQSIRMVVIGVRKIHAGWKPTCRPAKCNFQGCCGPRRDLQVDAAGSRLASRLAEIRLEFCVECANAAAHAFSIYAIAAVVRFSLGLELIGDVVMNSLFLALYLSAVLIHLCRAFDTGLVLVTLHTWYQLATFCFGAYLAFWNEPLFMFWKVNMVFFRVMIGICHPAPWMHLLWNLAWSVLGVFTTSGDIRLSNAIVNEVVIASFMTYLTFKIDEIQTSQLRSDMEASGYLRAKKTMERLLADMCDAVVELDPVLCVRQACPKLAGLLLRDASNKALKGDSFADLAFDEAHRERFREFVEQRSVPMAHEQNIDGDRRASSMYMNLRDSTGTLVSVQVFHSCHHDPFNELCHVVGVREVENNVAGAAMDTLGDGSFRQAVVRPPVERNDRAEDAQETRSVGESSESVASVASSFTGSETSYIPARTVPLIPEENRSRITVLFDAVTNEIVGSTIGFQQITGPLRLRTNLADIIVDIDSFHAWLRTEIHAAVQDAEYSKLAVRIAPVVNRRQSHFAFETEVCILEVHAGAVASQFGLGQPEDAEGEEERFELLVVLIFKEPVPKWRQKSTRNRRRHRTRRPERVEPSRESQNRVVEIAL